jgi:hypothetical protein
MAKEKTSQERSEPDSPFAPLLQLQQAGFGNIMGANSGWLESLGDMGAEAMSFVVERIKEDVKTQHEIMHCKDVAEIQHIQSRFVQNAIDQYQAETGKLVQMGTSAFTADGDKSS